ncbi:MAG: chemotaxis protein CheA [Pyrinomonadaceae bacterium]
MDQNQREFLLEIEELVEHVFADLTELRYRQADGRSSRQLIDRVFRRVHSVKGAAASCGLESVNQIAHEFENLLEAVRSGRTSLNDSILDMCESATDALAESVSVTASGLAQSPPQRLFDRLRAATQVQAVASDVEKEDFLAKIPFDLRQSLSEAEKHIVVTAVGEGSAVFVVTTSFDITEFDKQFSLFKEKLAQHGELVSTSPNVDADRPDRVNFRVLYTSDANLRELRSSVSEFANVSFKEVVAHRRSGLAFDENHTAATPPVSAAPASSLSNIVHTDLDKLDRLISATYELSRSTSNALELALSHEGLPPAAREELREVNERIRNSFMAVEDELINLRMVSLGPTLQRAARAGRIAARQAGKEIDFEVGGTDVLIDKLLGEAMIDPLIQLVRNAVGHGIEDPDERLRAGKKSRGTVRIEAINEGSRSRVRVTDDGRGIDPLVISEAAKRLGIMAGNPSLDFERSVRLIFRPGFTTLESVSDISGRGVGLDVVETAVEQVGGELGVSSKPARGTTFDIRLPVTFGLLQATVVVSGDNRYCIPANQIVAVNPLDAVAAQTIMNGPRKDLQQSGKDELPVVSLVSLLGQPDNPQQSNENTNNTFQLVVCEIVEEHSGIDRKSARRLGIAVNSVEGTDEVLVRNLGRHAGRWYGVAGATELRDGKVALVLDLTRLISGAAS